MGFTFNFYKPLKIVALVAQIPIISYLKTIKESAWLGE
jgi:hypothetical protein